jgi:hypothetical protein
VSDDANGPYELEVRKPELHAEQQRLGRHPWEKRPSETLKSFSAFAYYRDLGYYRTHRKVADELGCGIDTVKKWSQTHDWRERVDLWEVERDKRRLEAEMTEQESARRAEAIAGRAMLRRGLQRIQGDPEAGIEAIDVNDFDANDVTKFVAEGVRIQRLALGMPTDFAKGALHMSFQEVGSLVRELVSGLLPLIPAERHQQAFAIVRQISRSPT